MNTEDVDMEEEASENKKETSICEVCDGYWQVLEVILIFRRESDLRASQVLDSPMMMTSRMIVTLTKTNLTRMMRRRTLQNLNQSLSPVLSASIN